MPKNKQGGDYDNPYESGDADAAPGPYQDDEAPVTLKQKPSAAPQAATVAPTTYTDPYEKAAQEYSAQAIGGAGKLLAAKELEAKYAMEAPEEVAQAAEQALAGVRAKSGAQFGAQIQQGGGGGGAAMRQAQLSRGVAEGQVLSDAATQQIAAQRMAAKAQQEAAQAATEYATTQQKFKQAEADRERARTQELQDAQNAIQDEFDKMVERSSFFETAGTKLARRAQLASWVQMNYGNSPNPKVREWANQAVANIKANAGQFKE